MRVSIQECVHDDVAVLAEPASLLSGVYAHRHGVTDNFTELPATLETFPRCCKAPATPPPTWASAHMGENNDEPRPGFDYFVTHKGQGLLRHRVQLQWPRREKRPGYYTSVVTDIALDWLRSDHQQKPWMLILGHKATHSSYTPEPIRTRLRRHPGALPRVGVHARRQAGLDQAAPRHLARHLRALVRLAQEVSGRSPRGGQGLREHGPRLLGDAPERRRQCRPAAAVARRDRQLENTVVVFVGDNGLLEGEHGMVDKRTMHEPSIRIPMAVRYPGLGKGKVIDQQVLTIDMAPSLLELTGAPALEQGRRAFVSLVKNGPVPNGNAQWRRSWFYYYNYEKQFPYTPNVRGVRTPTGNTSTIPTVTAAPTGISPSLYDLRKDPGRAEKPDQRSGLGRSWSVEEGTGEADGGDGTHAGERSHADRRGDQTRIAGSEDSLTAVRSPRSAAQESGNFERVPLRAADRDKAAATVYWPPVSPSPDISSRKCP